jgi:gluconate 2-dehydrogenase
MRRCIRAAAALAGSTRRRGEAAAVVVAEAAAAARAAAASLAAAKAAGVIVTNTPGAVTDATADIALLLILATARRAGEGERLLRAGRWEGWGPTQMLGYPVSGRSVGIIGLGRIGKAIAKRCHHGFGMEVVFHNRSAVADAGVPARQVGMAEAMAADFVVVAVPGGPATRHMINAEALAAMRKNPPGATVSAMTVATTATAEVQITAAT